MSSNGNNVDLLYKLLASESEREVIDWLKTPGYWEDASAWRLFGDRENNYSIIGNQQANPAHALVEKLVNSVDAVLMRECLREGIHPESERAPQSIADALERHFEIKDGNLANLGADRRGELAQNIGLAASGTRAKPNYTVFDLGEGQTPQQLPNTFLSLAESNKLKIPFVQGKFNMGGSGVLRFCGSSHLNLILSRRDPQIADSQDQTATNWGFTIVRREDPTGGRKNSVYTYLAPGGRVLTMSLDDVELPYSLSGTQKIAPLGWGSVVKLYEYEMPGGLKTNILFDLYNEISLLLPRAALPVRFYERRDYAGHTLETTMSGLHVRLEEDKRENVEIGFPTGFQFNALGESFSGTIYAFRRGSSEKYRKSEGILFTSQGQTHGHILQSFFTRKRVGMSYLADSLLVVVECDQINRRAREILFMNSRDRLSQGELRGEIEKNLEEILRNHPDLRELRERRRREAIDSKLADSKPLKDVLNEILLKSPGLAALFLQGADIKNPFKSRLVGEGQKYEGKKHPTLFRIKPAHAEKDVHSNLRFRLQFETDVVNDYFERDSFPGSFKLLLDGEESTDFVRNLWNGTATITTVLPEGAKKDHIIHGRAIVTDETLIEPFLNQFTLNVIGPKESSGGGNGKRPPKGDGKGDRVDLDQLQLPQVNEVREDRWEEFGFDKFGALRVVYAGDDGYDFHINMDNVFLRTELKAIAQTDEAKLVEAQFKYAMVLLGLSILKDREILEENRGEEDSTLPVEDVIFDLTRSISPVVIPMINALGGLQIEDIAERGNGAFEYES